MPAKVFFHDWTLHTASHGDVSTMLLSRSVIWIAINESILSAQLPISDSLFSGGIHLHVAFPIPILFISIERDIDDPSRLLCHIDDNSMYWISFVLLTIHEIDCLHWIAVDSKHEKLSNKN